MGAQDLFNFYVSKGLAPHQAAGIVGNAYAESNYNPKAFNPAGGGQGALGAFQWRADRQTGLRNFAQERGADAHDLMTQAEYAWHEMQTTERAALDALMRATNPAEAAEIFRAKFERPGEDPGGYRRAAAEAQRVAEQYAGIVPQPGERQLSFGNAAPSRAQQGMAVFDPTLTNPDVPLAMGRPLPTAPEIFDMFRPDPQEIMPLMADAYGMVPDKPGVFALPELPGPQRTSGAPGIAPPPAADAMPGSLASSPTVGDQGLLTFGLPSAAPAQSGTQLGFGNLMQPDDATVIEATRAAEGAGAVPAGTTQSIVEEPDDSEEDKADKERRRYVMGQMLMQLSKGLGQMSVGQAVDITGVPLDYAQLAQNQDQIAQTDQRIELERQQEARLMQQAILDAKANDPRGAVNLFASAGFNDLAEAAMGGAPLNELFSEYSARTRDMRNVDTTTAQPPAEIQAAQMYMESYNANRPPEEQITLDEALTMRANNYGSPEDKFNAATLGTNLYEQDQLQGTGKFSSLADAQLYAGAMLAGVDVGAKRDEAANAQRIKSYGEEDTKQQLAFERVMDSNVALRNFADVENDMMTSDAQTGPLSDAIGQAQAAAQQLGFNSVASFLKDFSGVTNEELELMGASGQALAFAIARENKGQGSITEAERANLVRQVANLGQTKEGRATIVAQAQALNEIDALLYDKWLEVSPDGAGLNEWRQYRARLQRSVPDISSAVRYAKHVQYPNAFAESPAVKALADDNDDRLFNLIAPKVPAGFEMDLLPVFQSLGLAAFRNNRGEIIDVASGEVIQ